MQSLILYLCKIMGFILIIKFKLKENIRKNVQAKYQNSFQRVKI